MKKTLLVALFGPVLLAGAATTAPSPAGLAGSATVASHGGLNQQAVADPANVTGAARSHSCRSSSVAGALLTAAGLGSGSHWLTALGMRLTLLSETICY